MHNPALSTIAQILFESPSTLNYARVVAEMKQVLTRLKPDQLSITWDCDDLVFFDLAETRIALGFADLAEGRGTSCLSVSVGPRPGKAAPAADAAYDVLCSRIVERLQTRYRPIAVLWHQSEAVINADLLDRLTDALPAPEKILPPIEGLINPLWDAAEATEAAQGSTRTIGRFPEPPQRSTLNGMGTPGLSEPAAAFAARPTVPPANDAPTPLIPHSAELARLRDALYPEAAPQPTPVPQDAPISTQMRLTVHALNATLIVVYMPLGAAVMTYSLLRGENIRLSGRLMALTGTLLAFAHSPFGQSVASAVAGTLS